MKKVLLSTTALVAAGMMAGAAQAEEMMEEPISLSVGGYYRAAVGNVSGNDGPGQPQADRHSTGIAQDSEITFSGSTTLDNGLTVGVNAQLEVIDGGRLGGGPRAAALPGAGANTSGAVDEVWLYFKDDFGQLRLGSVESARQEMTNFAPNGAYNFGVNSPFFTFASGSWLATYDDGLGNEDAAKLVYFSPTFNGFRLGLSWAPDDEDGGQQYGSNSSANVGEEGGVEVAPAMGNNMDEHSHMAEETAAVTQQYQNQIAVGMEFSQSFMEGSSIRVAGGYETYEAEDSAADPCINNATTNCEPSSLHLGATVSFDQISVGGGYLKVEQGNNQDRTVYDLGLRWSEGPMAGGLLWGQSSASAASGPDTEITRYAVNGTYVLGPGIDLQAQIDFGENDGGGNMTAANDWTQFMLGTAISF